MALPVCDLRRYRDYHREQVEYYKQVLKQDGMACEDRAYFRFLHQMHTHRFLKLDIKIYNMEFESKSDKQANDFANYKFIMNQRKTVLENIEAFLFSQV